MSSGFPVYGANGKIGYYDQYNHAQPTILITCRGATCGTLNICEPQSYVTGNAMALDELDSDLYDLKYIFYALLARGVKDTISGTAQPQITRESLARVTLPIPRTIEEQRRIAHILDRADAIRRKRKQAIALTEQLLRSTFLEIFGDPVTNPKAWPEKPLSKLADVVSGVAKGKQYGQVATREVPYMRVANVQDGHLNLSEIKTISVSAEEESRFQLQMGDVLLTEGGDPDKLGRGTVWNNEVQGCIHQNHIFRVRITDEVTPHFLSAQIGSQRGKRYFLSAAKQTTGIATINLTQLKSFPVLVPPPFLQEKFENQRLAIAAQLELQAKASEQTEALFASLVHSVFPSQSRNG